VSLGQVALDGTKVKANASKHKAMSHERMLKVKRQLEAEMRALLRKAEIIDALEDGQYGKGKRGDELPEELQRLSSRLEWIRKAKSARVATASQKHRRKGTRFRAAAPVPGASGTLPRWRRERPESWRCGGDAVADGTAPLCTGGGADRVSAAGCGERCVHPSERRCHLSGSAPATCRHSAGRSPLLQPVLPEGDDGKGVD